MTDISKRLCAYPEDPTVVMSRAFVEEIAAHIERVEADLADGRQWLEARAAVLQELAETKAELAAERKALKAYQDRWLPLCLQRDKLREALERIAAIEDKAFGGDWEEIEEARTIARAVLEETGGGDG